MAGYTRDDVTDQISNGNNIDATALDGEFDAIQGAFASSGGHTHDGTTGGGSPILATGPTQDIVASATSLTPKTDDAIDLGSATYEWRHLFIDGTANIDTLVADTADINAGTIDGVVIGASAAGAITGTTITGTSLVGPLTGNADTATVLATARTINGTSFNGSSAITTANWGTARTITVGGTGKSVDGSGAITWSLAEIGVGTLGQQASGAVTITGGTITGITDLTVADGGTGASTAAGARTNLGLVIGTDVQAYDTGLASIAGLTTAADRMIYTTASDVYATTTLTSAGRALIDDANAAEQLVTLGLTTTAAELNYVDGVTSNIQTQLDTKAATSSLGGLATLDVIDEDDMATDSATRPPSQQSVKAYVNQSLAPQYESAETTITDSLSGSYTFTHGLGATPKRVRIVARCKTAEATFSVGDEVDLTSAYYDPNSGGSSTTIANATNVKFYHYYLRAQTGAGNTTTTLTAANWKIVAYASL